MTNECPSVPSIEVLEPACAGCGSRIGTRLAFYIGGSARCLRCAVTYPPLMRRSLYTALVVGSILVLINQGNLIIGGDVTAQLLWKIPLTYAVPFCVATWGALINSRVSR
jgi:hypothetical protein